MSNAALSWINRIADTATSLSASSEVISLPVANLADDHLAVKWRGNGVTTAYVDAEFASAQPVGVVGVFGTNFTISASWRKVLHRPVRSFGVQLIDAAEGKYPSWVVVPAFWLFALLDFLSGMVRPLITYAVVLFYMLVKYSRFELMQSVVSDDTRWFDLVARIWSEDDMAVLTLVLSYWFGNRVAKYAFGWDNKR